MKSFLTTLFALSLAACAGYGNLGQERTSELVTPTARVLSHKSFAARAESSKNEENESITSPLMECVSDACKVQCASGHDKQSRPKWCMYFKEPADTR